VIDLPHPRPAHLGEYPRCFANAQRINTAFRKLNVIRF
jgi:hypothetical protein